MRKSLLILSLAVLSSWVNYAQNEDDALRLSMSYFGGTARNMATAGALSAMGADFSNATQNPAGLGRLTKSNVSFTGNFEFASTTSTFYGNSVKDGRRSQNFGNLSYVKAYELDPNTFNNWYSVQFGFGINRVKSFNDEITYSGSADSSILHSFIADAEGTDVAYIYDDHPFTAGLAYDVFAIDPDGSGLSYTTQFQNGKAQHSRTLSRKGGITEFNLLTISGNYANKLLIGGSFNFVSSKYAETMNHAESYSDTSNWLNSINYTGRLDITGRGLNARIGAIYMPMEELRIGLAVETPTTFWMSDFWTNNMTAETDAGPKFVESEFVPSGSYKYRIRTPFKANVSAAYVLKKFGSVGAEVEFVDYRSSRLKDRNNSLYPYSFAAENTQIDNIYKPVINFKIGAEARIKQRIYARGGFAYYGTPYSRASGNSQSPTLFVTAGGGYNFGVLHLDIAYVLQSRNEEYYAYDPTINGSMSTFDVKNSQLVLTVGARF